MGLLIWGLLMSRMFLVFKYERQMGANWEFCDGY